jgi:hypothetical protein
MTIPAAAALCIAPELLLLCTTGPVQSEKSYSIVLTLDDKTNTTATFSGMPITAFCTFRDSIAYGDIAWHLGSGKILRPRTIVSKIKTLQVQFYWDIMPLKKDSVGRYFDSVYLSMGGENYRSNSACVFVTNVPPVIDSIKISRRVYSAQDTLRDTVKSYDSLPSMLIRIFAHDLNQNALASSWSGSGVPRIIGIANSINANYQLPHARITDTLNCSVYDRQGGNCDKVIFITSALYTNSPPLIDSVQCGDSLFRSAEALYSYQAAGQDSLVIRIFGHDPDSGDVQKDTVFSSSATQVTRLSAMKFQFVCPDSTYNDTLTAMLLDANLKTSSKSIVIAITKR